MAAIVFASTTMLAEAPAISYAGNPGPVNFGVVNIGASVTLTLNYAITSDNGSFSLPNLPPGKYTVTAWHEDYGTQQQEITVTGNETKSVDFSFKAKAY